MPSVAKSRPKAIPSKPSKAKAAAKSKSDRHASSHYASGSATTHSSSFNTSGLNKLFDSYRDNPVHSPDELQIEGTQKYLADLNIGLDSPLLLVLSTLVRSPSLGTISRQGFVDAWSFTNAPTPKHQAQALENMAKKINTVTGAQALPPAVLQAAGGNAAEETLFKRVYKTTFALALPTNVPNARAVPLEEAGEYWKLLLGPSSPGLHWVGSKHGTPLLDWWLEFLEAKWRKAVNRDLWNQTLLFAEKSTEDESMSFWSEESAWPGVIDEFVEYAKERKNSMDTS